MHVSFCLRVFVFISSVVVVARIRSLPMMGMVVVAAVRLMKRVPGRVPMSPMIINENLPHNMKNNENPIISRQRGPFIELCGSARRSPVRTVLWKFLEMCQIVGGRSGARFGGVVLYREDTHTLSRSGVLQNQQTGCMCVVCSVFGFDIQCPLFSFIFGG
jgi:hypothetical protein